MAKRRSPGVWLLLLAAGAARLLILRQLGDHPLTQPDAGLDTTAYVQLAREVVAGNPSLGPGLFYVSPLYIYFLAALLAIVDSFTVVRAVQVGLGTASVGLIFLTARHWYGERAAFIAGALAAMTGLFAFYEVLILQASIDAFLTSAALYFLTAALRGKRRPDWNLVAAGLVWGVQTLNRPNVLLAAIGVALVLVVATRRLRPAVLLAAGLLAGISPVLVRNIVVSNQWSLVSSHGGLNFYIGNNERATGFYMVVPGVRPSIVGQEKDTRRIVERAYGRAVSDAEVSDYFFDRAWDWIKGNPGAAAALFVKKFAFAFHAQSIPLPQSYPFFAYDAGTALRFLAIGPWLLVPLGLVGLVAGGIVVQRREYWAWAAFVPAYAASIALFFIAERYRLPLLVPFAAGAGAAIDLGWRAASSRRWTRLAIGAVAAAVLAAFVNYRAAVDEGRWMEGLRLAERLVILERYDEAATWANWLESHHPRPGAGMHGVGEQLLALNRVERALPYLERAYQANPSDPRIGYDYGRGLLKAGRAAEAVPLLRRGFEAGIDLPAGGYDYAAALKETGDLAGAAAALQRIHPAEEADEEAWLQLGRLGMEIKSPEIAEPYFRRAAAMVPGSAAARLQYGLNLLVLKRYQDAARELGEAVRLDPRDSDALSRLAYSELQIGHVDEALAHARAALAINPDDPLARQLLTIR